MSNTHECKWCGSDDCDALVVCDLCFEDISEADPIYHYDPEDPEADGDGYIRICKQCEFTLTLAKISVQIERVVCGVRPHDSGSVNLRAAGCLWGLRRNQPTLSI